MEPTDRALLDRYLSGRDEAAFATLVRRYLDFVHGVASRVTANDELARDVAQATFIRLAHRAASLPPCVALATWLHRVARGLAIDLVRVESRRKSRELGSGIASHSAMDSHAVPEPDWAALSPVVDALVARLPTADREVLLLRYYRNESHAAIAIRLGLTEGAARKRALRALEKLRILLGRRGIATSAAALATLLPAHASPAAPSALTHAILHATHGLTPVAPHFLRSTILAVTSAEKAALAAALLLLLAATDYTLAPDTAVAASKPASATPASGKFNPARTRTTRSVPGTPEERRERLRAIVAIPLPNPRAAELIAYLDGLSPDLYQETVSTLIEFFPRGNEEALTFAVAAWAKTDPLAALGFAKTQPLLSIEQDALRSWAALDLPAAAQWLIDQPLDPARSPGLLYHTAAAGMTNSPEKCLEIIDRFPDAGIGRSVLESLASLAAHRDELQQRLFATATPDQLAILIGSLASSYDVHRGSEVFRQHPEALAYAKLDQIYATWAWTDLAGATASVAEIESSAFRQQAAAGLIEWASRIDSPNFVELSRLYPEAVTDDHRRAFITTVGRKDPELALSQIPGLSDEGERDYLIVSQLTTWLASDSAAARKWLAAHPQPAAVLDRLPHQP